MSKGSVNSAANARRAYANRSRLIDALTDAEAALKSLDAFCQSDAGMAPAPTDAREVAAKADAQYAAAMNLVTQLEPTQNFEYLDPTTKDLRCSDALAEWGSQPGAPPVLADRISTMLDAIQRVRWTLNPPNST